MPGGGTAGALALVGRELCLFLLVDASRVPVRQRPEFVALAVRRSAPFADPDFDVLWLHDHAATWYWSRERVLGLVDGDRSVRFRAESVFRGSVPAGDTEQLLALDVQAATGEHFTVGTEARIWRRGRLLASRWWPQAPSSREWATFARGAGLEASDAPPDVEASAILEKPLNASTPRVDLRGQLGLKAPLVAGILATIGVALLAWQAVGVAHAAWSAASVEDQISLRSAKMETIISARARADAARTEIDALLALRTPASQMRLLGEIKRVTPGTWELSGWTQSSPAILEVGFSMSGADVAAIVTSWESSPLLEEVAPATNNRSGEVSLQATLTPLPEQSP